jgi:hypothetical protein
VAYEIFNVWSWHLIKKGKSNESVEAGREFVDAYVEFVHYVEKLRFAATGTSAQHGESNGAEAESQHHH